MRTLTKKRTRLDEGLCFAWSERRSTQELCSYPSRLQMLPELIHRRVWDAHVPEHSFQFRCELTSTFSLKHTTSLTVPGLRKRSDTWTQQLEFMSHKNAISIHVVTWTLTPFTSRTLQKTPQNNFHFSYLSLHKLKLSLPFHPFFFFFWHNFCIFISPKTLVKA